uniref:Notch ligand N-terminal domain-containing protein n=1 Tax=Astatotilapia calliptera TaxID=8154 RepID=A0A3P8RG54_ASTCA
LWLKLVSQSTGYFELQLISVENVNGELAGGECCDGPRSSQDLGCTEDECDTYFKVCLKEYQMEVATTGSCTFRAASTQVLGGNFFLPTINPVKLMTLTRLSFPYFTVHLENIHGVSLVSHFVMLQPYSKMG